MSLEAFGGSGSADGSHPTANSAIVDLIPVDELYSSVPRNHPPISVFTAPGSLHQEARRDIQRFIVFTPFFRYEEGKNSWDDYNFSGEKYHMIRDQFLAPHGVTPESYGRMWTLPRLYAILAAATRGVTKFYVFDREIRQANQFDLPSLRKAFCKIKEALRDRTFPIGNMDGIYNVSTARGDQIFYRYWICSRDKNGQEEFRLFKTHFNQFIMMDMRKYRADDRILFCSLNSFVTVRCERIQITRGLSRCIVPESVRDITASSTLQELINFRTAHIATAEGGASRAARSGLSLSRHDEAGEENEQGMGGQAALGSTGQDQEVPK